MDVEIPTPSPHPQSTAPRFNGATSGWTWKSDNVQMGVNKMFLLQWGHVRMDVEIRHQDCGAIQGVLASMGPRPDGRGNTARGNVEPLGVGASMGPRPDGRGNFNCSPATGAGSSRFNGATSGWTWKCGVHEYETDGRPTASMGPRPDGRGNRARSVGAAQVQDASMGPRPDGRGNHADNIWTRARNTWLQWGHVRMDVEMRGPRCRPRPRGQCFNGATSGWTWKYRRDGARVRPA